MTECFENMLRLWLIRPRFCSVNIVLPAEQSGGSAVTTTNEEPKWKQKLAAADKHAEETRRATAKVQRPLCLHK